MTYRNDISDTTQLNNKHCRDIFLKRIWIYRLQSFLAGVVAFLSIVLGEFVVCELVEHSSDFQVVGVLLLSVPVYNTVTYLCSLCLANKYGINMFDDLDQEWLKENQGYTAETFGEIFSRLLQCRKIAGPYMFIVLIPLICINSHIAYVVEILYIIGYSTIYRETYLVDALSDRIPRAFGGGIVISRTLDNSSDNTVNK